MEILVVDDEEPMRCALKRLLEHEGYVVQECEDGSKALDMLKQTRFTLVITDLRMPNVDGMSLLAEIKKMDETIEVIIISGVGNIDGAVDAMKRGAYDFIKKPIDNTKLLNTVKRCVEKCLLKSENLELKERMSFFEVSQALISTLDLKSLLNLIMESVQKVVLSDQGSMMLFKGEKLCIEASFGLDKILEPSEKCVLPGSLAWKVIKNGEPLVIGPHTKKNPLFEGVKGYREIKSSMVIPLKIKNRTIGIFNVSRTKILTEFTQRDLSMLTIFAGQAASAIENAYLYKKIKNYGLMVRKEKENVEAIVENISDGIIVCDSNDKIILINRSAREILRLGDESGTGKSFSVLFNSKSLQKVSELLTDFLEVPQRSFVEKKLNLNIQGENVFLRVTVIGIESHMDHKVRIIMTFNDITKLIQSQKVAAWQEMARGIAHEVKNPLTPILWAAEAIREQADSDVVEKKCATIIREITRIQTLISDFSSFAKLSAIKLASESIEEILEEILYLYSNFPDVTIKTDLEKDLPRINVDKNMIKQVFINLINNAIEAMPKGGNLTITGKAISNDTVSVLFKDTGKGIPDDKKEQIFDPYFTTKKSGTGLGLSISSKVIYDHNGEIKVISKPNQGTTFIVNLPV